MIEIINLVKRYKDFELEVKELLITVPELLIIRGSNGSGKTTFMELMLDLIRKDGGKINLFGEDISKNENWTDKVNAFLGDGFLIGYLKPLEYFNFVSNLRRTSGLDKITNIDYSHFLDATLVNSKSRISSLSKGQQSKIGIVGTLIGSPKIILFDEPLAHLDEQSKTDFMKLIDNYISVKGATIILSDHGNNFDYFNSSIHEITFEKGKIIAERFKSREPERR